MPKLRDKATGVVVSVSDSLAAKLGARWEPVREPRRSTESTEESTTRRRRSSK